ncbi:MAG: hypothetical protein WCI73_05500 [Phycisphaerae bacterium]
MKPCGRTGWTWLISLCLLALLGGCGAPVKMAVVRPGQSVGEIKLGMTLAQVQQVVGVPRVKKQLPDGYTYAYPSAGLSIFAGPADKPLLARVMRITCGSGLAENSVWLRNFWGKTHEGVGIGTSREEVLKTYGPPEAGPALQNYHPRTDEGELLYHARGIIFFFEQDKLVRMVVIPAAPPRTPATHP